MKIINGHFRLVIAAVALICADRASVGMAGECWVTTAQPAISDACDCRVITTSTYCPPGGYAQTKTAEGFYKNGFGVNVSAGVLCGYGAPRGYLNCENEVTVGGNYFTCTTQADWTQWQVCLAALISVPVCVETVPVNPVIGIPCCIGTLLVLPDACGACKVTPCSMQNNEPAYSPYILYANGVCPKG